MSSRSVVITLLTIAACFSRVLLVQSTSTSDYSPSEDVKNGHNLIHWNPAPQDSREVNYLLSIIFPAAVITIIGLLSVIVFQLTLIGRWCMRSFKCCGVSKTLASYRGNLMVFGCLLIGLTGSIVGFFVIRLAWRFFIIKKWNKRNKTRVL